MNDIQICGLLSLMSFCWSMTFFATGHESIASMMGVTSVVALAMCYRGD